MAAELTQDGITKQPRGASRMAYYTDTPTVPGAGAPRAGSCPARPSS
ncbi:hypothetical protein [Streptomyces sp. NPDC002666]